MRLNLKGLRASTYDPHAQILQVPTKYGKLFSTTPYFKAKVIIKSHATMMTNMSSIFAIKTLP